MNTVVTYPPLPARTGKYQRLFIKNTPANQDRVLSILVNSCINDGREWQPTRRSRFQTFMEANYDRRLWGGIMNSLQSLIETGLVVETIENGTIYLMPSAQFANLIVNADINVW